MATPLPTLPAHDGAPQWHDVQALIRDWQPQVLVLGVPRNDDGSESAMTERVRTFGRWLAGMSALPVEEIDEHLTSAEAETVLRDQRRSGERPRRVQPADIDRMAALLMAETWCRTRP
jgi:putative Holliday junction resolvase